MEQYRYCENSVKKIVAFMVACIFLYPWSAFAQEECNTVKDCAQAMVRVANDLRKENADLLKRIEALEKSNQDLSASLSQQIETKIVAIGKGNIHKPSKGTGPQICVRKVAS